MKFWAFAGLLTLDHSYLGTINMVAESYTKGLVTAAWPPTAAPPPSVCL